MKATYIDHMGDDLRVVNAARVSFSKESSFDKEYYTIGYKYDNNNDKAVAKGFIKTDRPEMAVKVVRKLNENDKKLLNYLARHNHWTPFSHPQITLREKVPVFVARQRFKHMIGFTYNEVSRRYVSDKPEFFIPSEWRDKPEGSIKQGSGNEVVFKKVGRYKDLIEDATSLYKYLIESGVAPEQARMILPQSMYTEYYVTGSLAAWARAYKLRIDSHAQKEIQDLAKQWGEIISPLFPVSWEVLTNE